MPILIRCPSCERPLRVPDSLLSKKVKCPSCQTRFTAEPEGPEPPENADAEEAPAERPASRRPAPPVEEGVTDRPSRSGSRPARRRPADEEEPEEQEESDEEEEERPRRRRRRRRRRRGYSGAAASAVTGPAIALMIVGGLGTAVHAVFLVLRILNVGMLAANGGPPGANPHDEAYRAGVVVGGAMGIIIDVLGIIWGIVVVLGAIQMKALKNHGLAMTTCILAMVPINCCCILGLPFGIWGLAAINRPEVREAFR